jgi:hypothetical protein
MQEGQRRRMLPGGFQKDGRGTHHSFHRQVCHPSKLQKWLPAPLEGAWEALVRGREAVHRAQHP